MAYQYGQPKAASRPTVACQSGRGPSSSSKHPPRHAKRHAMVAFTPFWLSRALLRPMVIIVAKWYKRGTILRGGGGGVAQTVKTYREVYRNTVETSIFDRNRSHLWICQWIHVDRLLLRQHTLVPMLIPMPILPPDPRLPPQFYLSQSYTYDCDDIVLSS